MKPLTAMELLTVWERGLNETLLQKTLHLLSAACPELDFAGVAELSVGRRDAGLLLLREWMFGSRLMNTADCPVCAGRIEWDIDIENIRLQLAQQEELSKGGSLEVDEFSIRFRLPTSADMARVIAAGEERSDPLKLLADCILEARCNGAKCGVDDLPEKVLQALSWQMEVADPQADIWMALTCPYCSHQWEVQFDIVSYLWVEIDRWAKRMLQDVHILASAYGWTERDILHLSPMRRQFYLGMVNL